MQFRVATNDPKFVEYAESFTGVTAKRVSDSADGVANYVIESAKAAQGIWDRVKNWLDERVTEATDSKPFSYSIDDAAEAIRKSGEEVVTAGDEVVDTVLNRAAQYPKTTISLGVVIGCTAILVGVCLMLRRR